MDLRVAVESCSAAFMAICVMYADMYMKVLTVDRSSSKIVNTSVMFR